MNAPWWNEGLTEVCGSFQMDLSSLVDGELDELASSRAIGHLEHCSSCREFFDDMRLQVRLHLDLAEPDRLLERFTALTGRSLPAEAEAMELEHRLSSIFYQLGKAYLLSAIDPGFRQRVFEPAVRVEAEQTRGRGFIDGVLHSGRGKASPTDWMHARHMLNGQLAKIEGTLEKGKRLLEEALAVEPGHEEARIYLAYAAVHEGKRVRAAAEFRRIFRTAINEENRGHAVVQLGLLRAGEGDYKAAIACFRWLCISGLAELEERFFFARFNIGMYYAHLRQREASLRYFRELLDLHPARAGEVAGFFRRSPLLREAIDAQRGFAGELLERCPELFRQPAGTGMGEQDSGSESSEQD